MSLNLFQLKILISQMLSIADDSHRTQSHGCTGNNRTEQQTKERKEHTGDSLDTLALS